MLPSTGARSPLFALAVSAGFVLIFIFGFLAWQSPPRIPFPHGSTHVEISISDEKAPISIKEVIRLLYSPLKVSPTESVFQADGETKFELPDKPRYTKKLGQDVLILDLDTRPLQSTEDYNKGEYEWTKINHVSGGVFNHYTYATIHGYDYKFIVFLDADATFRFMNLPIEWMLNYWKIEPHHAITMALDPWDPKEPQYNSDRFNRTYTNTGFMVVQNNENVMDILKAWHECPDDTRYKGCSEWKQPKFHEQSAFGEYIRYDFEEYIKELPCAEANGFPGVQVSNCQGKFIRHYWFEKHLVKKDFRENMMQAISLPIQRIFAENVGGVIVEQNKNEIL